MTEKERGFNVPRHLRESITDALKTDSDQLMPHELAIANEISSGKTVYREHIEWLQEFFSSVDVQYLLHGGDDARDWLDKVDSPTSRTASAFSGRDNWVFFVAGPDETATLADSVYSIDPKTDTLYGWDGSWSDMGSAFESDIDRPMLMEVDFGTAKAVAEWSVDKKREGSSIDIKTVDPIEYNIFRKAEFGLDYKLLDRVSDFISIDTGEDPSLLRERSKNAQRQVRDGNGKFIGGGPSGSSSSGGGAGSGAPTPATAVDADGNKPETDEARKKRLSELTHAAIEELDTARSDDDAVTDRLDSDQVRATLDESTNNSPQPADQFMDEFKGGEAAKIDNRDVNNRPKTTFADEESYEPDPEAVRPTNISTIPEADRAFVAIVDKDDHNAVLNLAVVAKVQGQVYGFVRMNSAWYHAPELIQRFSSATPPFLVKLEDEEQIGNVIEQIDSGDLGADDQQEQEEQPDEEQEAVAAALVAFEQEANPAFARDAVILASLSGNHHMLTREAIIASELGLLDARSVDDYGTILTAAGVPGVADTPGDYAAVRRLKKYWLHGPGAAKIRWGTPGDWTRCNRNLRKYMGTRAKGYCQNLHEDANGFYTGDKRNV